MLGFDLLTAVLEGKKTKLMTALCLPLPHTHAEWKTGVLGIYKAEGHSINGVANNRQLRLEGKVWALISPETRGYFPLINNRPQEIYSNGFAFG